MTQPAPQGGTWAGTNTLPYIYTSRAAPRPRSESHLIPSVTRLSNYCCLATLASGASRHCIHYHTPSPTLAFFRVSTRQRQSSRSSHVSTGGTPSHPLQILHAATRPLTYSSPGHARELECALNITIITCDSESSPSAPTKLSKLTPRLQKHSQWQFVADRSIITLCICSAQRATPARDRRAAAIRRPSGPNSRDGP